MSLTNLWHSQNANRSEWRRSARSERARSRADLPHARHLFASVPRRDQTEVLFRELAERWRADTHLSSSVTEMVLHPAYQRIIGLGPRVIPLLLRDMQQTPDHWFWALEALTGENPVPQAQMGEIEAMANAWIEWGRSHRYIR